MFTLDKATIAHRLLALAEGALGRPFAVRDWILRATSTNGLEWVVDPAFRHNPAARYGETMSYYASRSPDGRLWLCSSVRRAVSGEWHTVLTSGRRSVWIDCNSYGQMMAPVWVGTRHYCVLLRPGEPAAPCCFDASDVSPGRWTAMPLSFSPAVGQSVQDFHVVRTDGDWVGWLALRADGRRTSIQQWRSRDGLEWRLELADILAGGAGSSYLVANNPWAVAPVAPGEPWRLYFRVGEEEAVGNRIVSATSSDLATWIMEPGVRIAPHGRWAAHGVGFPHVERFSGRWVMHFSGFWGASARGEAAADSWRAANRRCLGPAIGTSHG